MLDKARLLEILQLDAANKAGVHWRANSHVTRAANNNATNAAQQRHALVARQFADTRNSMLDATVTAPLMQVFFTEATAQTTVPLVNMTWWRFNDTSAIQTARPTQKITSATDSTSAVIHVDFVQARRRRAHGY